MPDPTPQQKPEPTSFVPSGSTNATLLGGAAAAVLMNVLGRYGIYFDAGTEAAITALCATFASYLPASGRR